MCGRYTLATPSPADVRARFAVGDTIEIRKRYNVAPGDDVLAVTSDRDGKPRGELLRWGLLPAWAQRPETGLKMINARVETAAQRPAFRRAFERFRCLILADGFYEWQSMPAGRNQPNLPTQPKQPKQPKQPFHITRAGNAPFAFAGLWSSWRGEDGSELRSCAILTTVANSTLSPLHDRMPVILAPEAEAPWLEPQTPSELLYEILAGLTPEQTRVRPVSNAVNDARYDGPECLAPPAQSGQAALF
ncbi:MAG: SOS response-associated peptidase [Actinomycetota bacterium]|nr:SOS response-associated peptidase [Actinomycetota bacterium]